MTDLEILFVRRLMARDAAIWTQRGSGQKLLAHGAARVLAEWRDEQYGERRQSNEVA